MINARIIVARYALSFSRRVGDGFFRRCVGIVATKRNVIVCIILHRVVYNDIELLIRVSGSKYQIFETFYAKEIVGKRWYIR